MSKEYIAYPNHTRWCEFLHFWEIMFGWYFSKKPYGHYNGQCQRCKRYPKKIKSKVTVCSKCLRASCWQGFFFCEEAKIAGTIEKTIDELKKLALEDSIYWKDRPDE